MKKISKILLLVVIILSTHANALTKAEHEKLNSPVVKEKGDEYHIEEYNAINFTKNVLFDGQSLKRVIVKTEASMKKGVIHKEQFLAISSSASDQIMQAVFMNPEYFPNIKSIELLIKKPQKVNLAIQMVFKKEGIESVVKNSTREEKKFVPYDDMFHKRLQ